MPSRKFVRSGCRRFILFGLFILLDFRSVYVIIESLIYFILFRVLFICFVSNVVKIV